MRVFLVAGEPSGDRLGAALMAGLKTLVPEIAFQGVGGPLMQAEGLVSIFPMDELSIMGIAEVLPKYRHLSRRMVETADAVLAARPDVLVTIDSPDFCLRVTARVKAASDIRCVHYVAPSVWAWRPGRAKTMARSVDQVLALLPFEPPYMEAAGMRCDFVGHPVVAEPQPTPEEVRAFRQQERLGTSPILLVLPGSRRSEVSRLMPTFGEAVALLLARRPDLRVLIVVAGPVAGIVRRAAQGWPGDPLLIDPTGQSHADAQHRKLCAFASANLALAASGTVSLELAAADTPMVIAYDMAWLSWQIMSRMARIDTVTLVNLVTDTRVVPEFLGPDCQPGPIAASLAELAEDPGVQSEALSRTMDALGRGDEPPGLRAARAVLDGLNPQ